MWTCVFFLVAWGPTPTRMLRGSLRSLPRGINFLHTENDVPQPHVLLACGFWNTKPRLSRLVS